jgi:hypothetical protein
VTLDSIKTTLHYSLTFVLACFIEIGLIVGACKLAENWQDSILSLAILALGFAVGSLLGTATSPNDKGESARFAVYGRAVIVFFTGYAASKLDQIVGLALSPDVLTNLGYVAWFRILAFAATVLLVAKATFSCRSYDSPHPATQDASKGGRTTTAPAAPAAPPQIG